MSVIVKGMGMPKNCYDCPFIRASVAGDFYCVAGDGIEEDLKKLYRRRMSDCPLVEVKEPHGRLIDADELANKTFYSTTSAPYITYKTFCNAPTVIEAERRDGMSKYIVELKPEYEDSFKGVMILGAKDSNLFVDVLAVDDLEVLNSDYINEHFGSAYQKGLDAAWEAARKISLMPADEIEKVFPGAAKYNRYNLGYSGVEAIEKLKAYEEKQKEDEIKVGDEVEHTVSGYTSKAIFLEKINDDEDWYKCLFWTGCGVTILSYPKRQFKRTGRHFDIDKILEEMRHD